MVQGVRYTDIVLRRLGSLMLAIVVTSAPVALQWCRASCASESPARAAGGGSAHHSCHDRDPGTSRLVVTSAPHICGHGAALPTRSAPDANVVVNIPVAVVAHVAVAVPPRAGDVLRHSVPITTVHEPPVLIPLRI